MTIDIEALMGEYKKQIPVRVDMLIENAGLRLEKNANLDANISGQIKREPDGSYTISANSAEHEYRRRFTMAHEFGHFLLHRSILDRAGGVNDNVMYRAELNAPVYNAAINELHERQANSFAANLLMPDKAVKDHWLQEAEAQNHPEGTPSLQSMYRKFEVSPSAMRWKLKSLSLGFHE